HLVDAQADVSGDLRVDAQVGERLHHVAVGLSCGDDPQSCLGTVKNNTVERVGAHVGERGVDLPVEDARFLLEDAVGPADVQSVRRRDKVGRDLDADSIWVNQDRGAGFDYV